MFDMFHGGARGKKGKRRGSPKTKRKLQKGDRVQHGGRVGKILLFSNTNTSLCDIKYSDGSIIKGVNIIKLIKIDETVQHEREAEEKTAESAAEEKAGGNAVAYLKSVPGLINKLPPDQREQIKMTILNILASIK